MKYFTIKDDLEQINWSPQTSGYEILGTLGEGQVNLTDLNMNRNKCPVDTRIKVHSRAFLTDSIQTSFLITTMGVLLISKRMYELINKFALPDHMIKNVELLHLGKTYDNYLVFYTKKFKSKEYYDFDRITFQLSKRNKDSGQILFDENKYQFSDMEESKHHLKHVKMRELIRNNISGWVYEDLKDLRIVCN